MSAQNQTNLKHLFIFWKHNCCASQLKACQLSCIFKSVKLGYIYTNYGLGIVFTNDNASYCSSFLNVSCLFSKHALASLHQSNFLFHCLRISDLWASIIWLNGGNESSCLFGKKTKTKRELEHYALICTFMLVKDSQVFPSIFVPSVTLTHSVLSCVSADNLCPESGNSRSKEWLNNTLILIISVVCLHLGSVVSGNFFPVNC